jgi:hypothetical protein
MIYKVYERVERKFEGKIFSACLSSKNGYSKELKPFIYAPISVEYDIEGIEHIKKNDKLFYAIRFSFLEEGEYHLEIKLEGNKTYSENFEVCGFANNGFIKISDNDKRYFSYTNGKPFFSMGINLSVPDDYEVSDNTEFGLSGKISNIGLKQYERWFKKCSQNGVNTARIWLGWEYFNPDTKEAYDFKLEQFTKIDMLLDLAEKYNLKLKLTFEHFRWFLGKEKLDTHSARVFNKEVYINGEKCTGAKEWLTEEKWRNAWLNKLSEFSARYSFDTRVFAFELFNEQNCMGEQWAVLYDEILKWNCEMAPVIQNMFPNHFVINSLGSLDSEQVIDMYKRFPFEKFGFMQMHRYLDQGAPLKNSSRDPIEAIKTGMDYIKQDDMPLIVAETGAVNNCHSGPFKYYQSDDDGLIFVDAVYTPVFLGSAGCGNIWHWNKDYVESKNLYKYFTPLAKLFDGIDFSKEIFESFDFSDDEVYAFVLKGRSGNFGFIRNKDASWQTILRDLNEPKTVSKKVIPISGIAEIVPIWEEDSVKIFATENATEITDVKYGALFKIK